MPDIISDKLYGEFMEVVRGGDEGGKARDFLVTHLKEFPQGTQDAIVMAFFEEALSKSAEDAELVSGFQKQGLEVAGVLEKAKRDLEAKAKLLELKEKI